MEAVPKVARPLADANAMSSDRIFCASREDTARRSALHIPAMPAKATNSVANTQDGRWPTARLDFTTGLIFAGGASGHGRCLAAVWLARLARAIWWKMLLRLIVAVECIGSNAGLLAPVGLIVILALG